MTRAPGRTFVLVHGGRHSAWCWHLVRQGLAERGIESVAVELSLGSIDADAAIVREVLDSMPGELVVVGHSRGGRVISVAAHGAANVARLVYLAAHVNEPELTMPNGPRPTARLSVPSNAPTLTDAQAREIFYHDVPDELAKEAIRHLRPSPPGTRTLTSELPAAWHDLPSTYIVCSDDHCIHPDDQRDMASHMDERFEIPTGHSAFLARPELVVELLARYA